MSRTISLITAVAVVALTFSVPTALGKSQPVEPQEPYVVGTYPDPYKRTAVQAESVELSVVPQWHQALTARSEGLNKQYELGTYSSAIHALGGRDRQSRPDFWNYDAQTGQKVANTSPGLTAQDLAAQYSSPSVPQSTSPSGGDRYIEWPQVGMGLGIGLGIGLLMIGLYLALKATRHRPLAH